MSTMDGSATGRTSLHRIHPSEATLVADRLRSVEVIDLRETSVDGQANRSEIFREPTIREAIPPSGTGYSIPPPNKALGRPRGRRIKRLFRLR